MAKRAPSRAKKYTEEKQNKVRYMSASLTHKSSNASHGQGCSFASCPACENSFENMEVTYTLFIDVCGSISLLLDKFFEAEVTVVVKQNSL